MNYFSLAFRTSNVPIYWAKSVTALSHVVYINNHRIDTFPQMHDTHANHLASKSPEGVPWTGRQRCGRSGGAGRPTWCRPFGQRCARQAGGPCLWYRSPGGWRQPGYDPAEGQWPEEWSHPARERQLFTHGMQQGSNGGVPLVITSTILWLMTNIGRTTINPTYRHWFPDDGS